MDTTGAASRFWGKRYRLRRPRGHANGYEGYSRGTETALMIIYGGCIRSMKTLAELQAIRDKARAQIGLCGKTTKDAIRVLVGMATCGIAAGARPVLNAFVEEVAKRGMQKTLPSPRPAASASASMSPWWRWWFPAQEKVTYVKMTPEKAVRSGERPSGQRQCGHGIHHRRQCHEIRRRKTECIVHTYWFAAVPAVPPPTASRSLRS